MRCCHVVATCDCYVCECLRFHMERRRRERKLQPKVSQCYACDEEKEGSVIVVLDEDRPDHAEFVCFDCQELSREL